jgi:pilus assembly protein CpaE
MTAGRVALVDGNLYSGDIAVSLNIISRNSISDLLPHLRDLDKELLDSASVVHRSGVSVLLAPDELELADAVTGEAMQRILKSMRTYFDYIVVDTCSLPDQVTMAALENADTILLIATPELPSLKNAARFIRTCREHGYPADKLMLVINRENSRNAISRADIEDNLKLKVGMGIRSDGRTLIRAINAGEPAVSIDRRSRIGRGVRQLATIIATGQVARVSAAASPAARVNRGPLAWIARRST